MQDMKVGEREKQVARVDRNKGQEWKQRPGSRKSDTEINPCAYCGLRKIHRDRRSCSAFGKTCDLCQKQNHFASVCRADKFKNTRNRNRYDTKTRKNRVKNSLEHESSSEDSSDEDFLSQSVAHMKIKRIKKRYSVEKTVPLMINDISIRAEPDNGAVVNVMDEFQFRALQHRSTEEMEPKTSKIKPMTLQNELPIKGKFSAIVRNKTCGIHSRFLVVKGRIN